MNRFIFSTIFIFININLINCSDDEADGQTQIPINVDLKNIKSEDFDIIRSIEQIGIIHDVKLESYKLTPKTNKKINKVTFGNVDIWNTEISTECSNITIYNSSFIFFVIKAPKGGLINYIHLRLKNGSLEFTGAPTLLYMINYEELKLMINKPQTLNISNEYDMLYFKHLYKQREGLRYETYEINHGEVFMEVKDEVETIWKLKPGLNSSCKKVRVFKQQMSVINKDTGKSEMDMVTTFVSLKLLYDGSIHFKFDVDTEKWVNINSTDFGLGIEEFIKKNINDFGPREESSSDEAEAEEGDGSLKNQPNTLDIFRKNKNMNYESMNLISLRNINVSMKEGVNIHRIVYNDQTLLEEISSEFEMNIIAASDNWYYVEVIMKSENDLTKDEIHKDIVFTRATKDIYATYYQISYTDGTAGNITRGRFLEITHKEIYNSDDPNRFNFTNFYELQGGSDVGDLGHGIRLKINPRYGIEEEMVPAKPVTSNDKPDDSEPADLIPPNTNGTNNLPNVPNSQGNKPGSTRTPTSGGNNIPPIASASSGGNNIPPITSASSGGNNIPPITSASSGGNNIPPIASASSGGNNIPPITSASSGGNNIPPITSASSGGNNIPPITSASSGGNNIPPIASASSGGNNMPTTTNTRTAEKPETGKDNKANRTLTTGTGRGTGATTDSGAGTNRSTGAGSDKGKINDSSRDVNEEEEDEDSEQSGFISSISRLSILIIITSMLI
ncbi:hypothetical protein MACJ_000435 [Theileria orientalis]|uniref:Uncharacterized protein n=1 Tax=Theileria orientalis TaxID=68886 RepID=A0A976M423_THEOR|nr:hypothetical protein MACJ_000435 [Theileria orientalis]